MSEVGASDQLQQVEGRNNILSSQQQHYSTSKDEEEQEHVQSVFNHNEEDPDSKQGGWKTFPYVTATVLGLSVAAGGWSSNLIVFLTTEFNVRSITAAQMNSIILGTNNLFPIAGAFLADSFFTSFSVITFFSFLSLLGVIMLTLISSIHSLRPSPCSIGSLITCESPSRFQYVVLYAAVSLASLGLGGTRFTIATMGADQFNNPKDLGVFFNWYFVALCMAIVFGGTAIVYVQENVRWGLGFGICCIANGVGLGVFLLGSRFYKQVKPQDKCSPFLSLARVIVAAIWKCKMSLADSRDVDYNYGLGDLGHNAPTKSFRILNRAALKTEEDKQYEGSYRILWRLCTVKEVEDFKTLIKIMPLWSTGVMLSTPICIFSSLTILQITTMDRHLGQHFKIPAASLPVINILSTAISIFMIDRFILPRWKSLTRRALTPLQRIGIGHVINIIALIGSALIERRRLRVVKIHSLTYQHASAAVPMSSLWLVLTLSLVGIGEAFHFPGQVTLCYQEFPKSMRNTSTAMISVLIGIGYYLSTVIINLVNRTTNWLPDDINQGRVDNVFWILVAIGVVNFGYYITCAKLFTYTSKPD